MAKTPAAKAPAKAAPATVSQCACGCGESVERTFRQGHDQRLISRLAEDIVYGSIWDGSCMGILKTRLDRQADMQVKITKVADYMRAKLTEALADKFERAAHRQWELQKSRDERDAARAERQAARATKSARKATKAKAATPSEEAGDAAPAKPALSIVKPTATNADVDRAEAAADATGHTLGAPVRVKVGKRTRNATVTGMSQAGKVTAVTFQNAGKDVVKTEGQFELA